MSEANKIVQGVYELTELGIHIMDCTKKQIKESMKRITVNVETEQGEM